MGVLGLSCLVDKAVEFIDIIFNSTCLLFEGDQCLGSGLASMVFAKPGPKPQAEVIPQCFIHVDVGGGQVVSRVPIDYCEKLLSIGGSPFGCISSNEGECQIGAFEGVYYGFILLVGVSVELELLEEKFGCAPLP
jgi:hypothetical protein